MILQGRRLAPTYLKGVSLMSPIVKTLAALAAVCRAVIACCRARRGHAEEHFACLGAEHRQAALEKCQSMGFKVSVAVVDRDGLPVVHAARRRRRPAHAGRRRPQGLYRAHLQSPSADFAKRMTDRPAISRPRNIPACWRSAAAADQSRQRGDRRGRRIGLARARTTSARRPASTRWPISSSKGASASHGTFSGCSFPRPSVEGT